jgi:DNA polymerase III subunit beta
MEFCVDTSTFADALEQIQGAVEKKSTIPILSHALVEVSATGLHLAATDLELSIQVFCPAPVKVAGNGAIPARRLLDIVCSLPDGEVRVRALENHWVQIGFGRSTFKLAAMGKDNFPALPEVPQSLADVPAGTLGGLIDRTAFAISNEESRYTLNGALLVLRRGKVEMIATDGSRLSLAVRETEVAGLKSEERMLVPRRALGALRRLADAQESDTPIKIARDDSHLFFSAGDSIVITRLISGQFPNYEAVLPQSHSIVLTLDAAGFREALARVSLLAHEQSHGVCLALEPGQLTLSTAGGNAGEAVESIDVTYSGEPLRVAFNCRFLLDFLGAMKSGQVEIALKDNQSAADLLPADLDQYHWRYVLMPMSL